MATKDILIYLRQGVGLLLLLTGTAMILFHWYRSIQMSFDSFRGRFPHLEDGEIPRRHTLLVMAAIVIAIIGFMMFLPQMTVSAPFAVGVAIFFAGWTYLNLRTKRYWEKQKQSKKRFGSVKGIRDFTESVVKIAADNGDHKVELILREALLKGTTSSRTEQISEVMIGLEEALKAMGDQYSEDLKRDTETAVKYSSYLLRKTKGSPRIAILIILLFFLPFICLFAIIYYWMLGI